MCDNGEIEITKHLIRSLISRIERFPHINNVSLASTVLHGPIISYCMKHPLHEPLSSSLGLDNADQAPTWKMRVIHYVGRRGEIGRSAFFSGGILKVAMERARSIERGGTFPSTRSIERCNVITVIIAPVAISIPARTNKEEEERCERSLPIKLR